MSIPMRFGIGVAMLVTASCGQASSPVPETGGESIEVAIRDEAGTSMTTIEITNGQHRWRATIADTPAGRDFLGQLPLNLSLEDYGGNEKIADLPQKLSRKGAPEAVTPRSGDIAYYAPWGNLAIFYADGHHSPGLIVLGRLEGDTSAFSGRRAMAVTIRRAD